MAAKSLRNTTIMLGNVKRLQDGASLTTVGGGGSRLEMRGNFLLDATVDSSG
jgi:hypothetical protein